MFPGVWHRADLYAASPADHCEPNVSAMSGDQSAKTSKVKMTSPVS